MTKNFSVLFVADTSSSDDCSAVQRLRVLEAGLKNLGARTGLLYLGDCRPRVPKLLGPIKIPLFLKLLKDYDFVHAAGVAMYVMGLAKTMASFKLVCDIHGSTEESRLLRRNLFDFAGNYYMLAARSSRYVARKQADCFVAVSESLREGLLTEGIEGERIEVIYNGVDTEWFKPCEKQSEIFTVTYAGAYQKWQGIENLIRTAYLLRNENIKFRMLGFKKTDSSMKDDIRKQLKAKVELIDFQPRIGDRQPASFVHELCQSDVLIIPRYWNPVTPRYCDPVYVRKTFGWLPTKFAEYLAIGKPIIVTSLDVSSEFVTDYNCGFVCDPWPQSLAEAILKAKRMPTEELKALGINSRRLAETHFDQRVVCKRYYDFLAQFS